MKTLEIHNLLSLLYTQEEAAAICGVKRESYTRAICMRGTPYVTYMKVLKARALKDLKGKKHWQHVRAAIEAIREPSSNT